MISGLAKASSIAAIGSRDPVDLRNFGRTNVTGEGEEEDDEDEDDDEDDEDDRGKGGTFRLNILREWKERLENSSQ